ncbi:MAG: Holliday junction branch migration protein RuvA [Thermoanaerobaculia bacterium]
MVHHLEGELVFLGPARAVIETAGVGFELRIPLSTYRLLKGQEGRKVRLLAHLQVMEDDLRLYGFSREDERTLFRLALSVAGVGPSTGFALLAAFEPAGFAEAIAGGDARALQRVKGVGPKLSERLVLELKDRTAELAALAGASVEGGGGPGGAGAGERAVIADAALVLVELGFGRREAEEKVRAAIARLLAGAPPPAPGGEAAPRPSLTVEAVIQAALRSRK